MKSRRWPYLIQPWKKWSWNVLGMRSKAPQVRSSNFRFSWCSIQCFNTTAYVKLKNDVKLNEQASKVHFVSYDSKSNAMSSSTLEICLKNQSRLWTMGSRKNSFKIQLRKNLKFLQKTRIIKIQIKIKIHYLWIQPHWTYLQPSNILLKPQHPLLNFLIVPICMICCQSQRQILDMVFKPGKRLVPKSKSWFQFHIHWWPWGEAKWTRGCWSVWSGWKWVFWAPWQLGLGWLHGWRTHLSSGGSWGTWWWGMEKGAQKEIHPPIIVIIRLTIIFEQPCPLHCSSCL